MIWASWCHVFVCLPIASKWHHSQEVSLWDDSNADPFLSSPVVQSVHIKCIFIYIVLFHEERCLKALSIIMWPVLSAPSLPLCPSVSFHCWTFVSRSTSTYFSHCMLLRFYLFLWCFLCPIISFGLIISCLPVLPSFWLYNLLSSEVYYGIIFLI